MPKVKILYEKTDGIYRLISKNAEGNNIDMGKKRRIAVIDKHDETAKTAPPLLLEEKTFIGRFLSMPFWAFRPLYKASYKHHTTLPFGDVVTGKLDMELYKKMSEDDTINELYSTKKSQIENFIMLAMCGALGFFAGVIFGPQILG